MMDFVDWKRDVPFGVLGFKITGKLKSSGVSQIDLIHDTGHLTYSSFCVFVISQDGA